MTWLLAFAALLAVMLLGLVVWRQLDHRADRLAWRALVATDPSVGARFDPSMVADLPDAAQRYFAFTIAPGTPLHTAVALEMTGELGQGTRDDHRYLPMQATQILAPPHGLVWKVRAGQLSGSDGALPGRSWTRFWLFGLVPVVRAEGPDHLRSAFGRVVAEAALWAPASLLPSESVAWQGIDENRARATVRYEGFVQAVDITVDDNGAPVEFVIQRWSNENPQKTFREQPFGGIATEWGTFGGYRLPTRVEGGNHFGTPDHFPFFKAVITSVAPA